MCPVSTIVFAITINRREITYARDIFSLGLITISIVVTVVIRLNILVLSTLLGVNTPPDVQAILRNTTGDVLTPREYSFAMDNSLIVLIFALVITGFQTMAISARHLIPASKKLPKQFQPFVLKKQKIATVIEEPEASTQEMEVVGGVDSGPLARLFDDYEKQGLISTHIDLEVC